MTFRLPKVKWLHLTGEVDKSVRVSCQIFSGFNTPKLLKSVIFDRVIQNIRRWTFWGHRVYNRIIRRLKLRNRYVQVMGHFMESYCLIGCSTITTKAVDN